MPHEASLSNNGRYYTCILATVAQRTVYAAMPGAETPVAVTRPLLHFCGAHNVCVPAPWTLGEGRGRRRGTCAVIHAIVSCASAASVRKNEYVPPDSYLRQIN